MCLFLKRRLSTHSYSPAKTAMQSDVFLCALHEASLRRGPFKMLAAPLSRAPSHRARSPQEQMTRGGEQSQGLWPSLGFAAT